jgi:hypothetical protein
MCHHGPIVKLTPHEKQALVGPTVVGCLLGMAVGVASLGFDSEYGHATYWQLALDFMVAFLASVAVAVVPLGLLPMAVQRLRQGKGSQAE